MIGYVSYGAAGGIRAVEQWRQITSNFQMFGVRNDVNLSTFTDFSDGKLAPRQRRPGELETLLTDIDSLLQQTS